MCNEKSYRKIRTLIIEILILILFTCSACNIHINLDEENVTVNGVKLPYKRTIHLEQVCDTESAMIKLGSGDMDLSGQKDNKISLDIVIFEKKQNDAGISFDNGEISTSSKGNYPVYISSIKGTLPENISLNLSAGSGDISIQYFHNVSEVSLKTGSGDNMIGKCTNIKNIDVQMGSGDLDVRDLNAVQNLISNSGSGDVLINSSMLSYANIKTGSGGIEISKTHIDKIVTETGSGDIILSNSTYDEISFDTGSGDVINNSSHKL